MTQRVVLGNPEVHRHLRAQVLPFPNEVMDISNSVSVGLMSSNGLFILFLILMAANVALLVFVRAATREREILLRVALGADRGRVVAQLFAETLVLGLAGAFVGPGWRWTGGTSSVRGRSSPRRSSIVPRPASLPQRCIHCARRRWWLIKHALNDAEVTITTILEDDTSHRAIHDDTLDGLPGIVSNLDDLSDLGDPWLRW